MYIDYDSCISNEGTRNLIFQQSFNDFLQNIYFADDNQFNEGKSRLQ